MQIAHYCESRRLLMGINVWTTQLQRLHELFLMSIKIQSDACLILFLLEYTVFKLWILSWSDSLFQVCPGQLKHISVDYLFDEELTILPLLPPPRYCWAFTSSDLRGCFVLDKFWVSFLIFWCWKQDFSAQEPKGRVVPWCLSNSVLSVRKTWNVFQLKCRTTSST